MSWRGRGGSFGVETTAPSSAARGRGGLSRPRGRTGTSAFASRAARGRNLVQQCTRHLALPRRRRSARPDPQAAPGRGGGIKQARRVRARARGRERKAGDSRGPAAGGPCAARMCRSPAAAPRPSPLLPAPSARRPRWERSHEDARGAGGGGARAAGPAGPARGGLPWWRVRARPPCAGAPSAGAGLGVRSRRERPRNRSRRRGGRARCRRPGSAARHGPALARGAGAGAGGGRAARGSGSGGAAGPALEAGEAVSAPPAARVAKPPLPAPGRWCTSLSLSLAHSLTSWLEIPTDVEKADRQTDTRAHAAGAGGGLAAGVGEARSRGGAAPPARLAAQPGSRRRGATSGRRARGARSAAWPPGTPSSLPAARPQPGGLERLDAPGGPAGPLSREAGGAAAVGAPKHRPKPLEGGWAGTAPSTLCLKINPVYMFPVSCLSDAPISSQTKLEFLCLR